MLRPRRSVVFAVVLLAGNLAFSWVPGERRTTLDELKFSRGTVGFWLTEYADDGGKQHKHISFWVGDSLNVNNVLLIMSDDDLAKLAAAIYHAREALNKPATAPAPPD